MPQINKKFIYLIAAIVILPMPFYLGEYFLYIATLTLVFTLASFGTNILSGYTNLLSLAGATFFGAGAFTTAILMSRYEVSLFPALLLAGLIGIALSLVVAIPTLRLEHVYLAIATLGYVFISSEIVKSLESLTGGSMGMGVPQVSIIGQKIDEVGLFYITLIIVTLLLIAGVNLSHCRFGRAFFAVKGSEFAARSIGIPAPKIKIIAFAVQAFYCAVAGGLYGVLVRFIDPSIFSIFVSISFLSIWRICSYSIESCRMAFWGQTAMQWLQRLHDSTSKGSGFPSISRHTPETQSFTHNLHKLLFSSSRLIPIMYSYHLRKLNS